MSYMCRKECEMKCSRHKYWWISKAAMVAKNKWEYEKCMEKCDAMFCKDKTSSPDKLTADLK